MGLVLCGVVYVTAPWIALLAQGGGRASIVPVLRLLGLVLVVQGLAAVPNALLERELEFRKKFYIDTIHTLVYAVLAVGLALRGEGVWSLVWGRLGAALASCLATWWFSPWRPRGRFNWNIAREVIGYGRFVAGAALASFLVVNIDDALIVRLRGMEVLGFYSRAYLLANLPVTSVAHIVSRVAFPAYARLRDQGAGPNILYLRLLQGTALLALPAAGGLLLLAEPFTMGVLGGKWAPVIPLLQCLAVYGFLRSLLSNTGPLFNATGVPQAILKTNLVQLSILAAVLFPLIQWRGAVGASAGILLGTLLSAPLAFMYLHRATSLDLRTQLEALRPLGWPAAAMVAVILGGRWGLDAWARETSSLVELLVVGGSGVLVYGGVLYFRDRRLLANVSGLLRGETDE